MIRARVGSREGGDSTSPPLRFHNRHAGVCVAALLVSLVTIAQADGTSQVLATIEGTSLDRAAVSVRTLSGERHC